MDGDETFYWRERCGMAGEVSPGGILLRGGEGGVQVEAEVEIANEHAGTDVSGRSVTTAWREERMGGGGVVA